MQCVGQLQIGGSTWGVKYIESQHVLSGEYPPITISDHEYSKLEVYYYSDPVFSSRRFLKFKLDDGVEFEVHLERAYSDISQPYVFKATCEHGNCVYSVNTSILEIISDEDIEAIIANIGGRVNNDVYRRKGLGILE